jgi:hypothetical protein
MADSGGDLDVGPYAYLAPYRASLIPLRSEQVARCGDLIQ